MRLQGVSISSVFILVAGSSREDDGWHESGAHCDTKLTTKLFLYEDWRRAVFSSAACRSFVAYAN
jgi:hypothetical protein